MGMSVNRRYKRSSLGKSERTRNEARFSVTFVWGRNDMVPRKYVTPDRRKALRYARSVAASGARIVLVKKGDFKRAEADRRLQHGQGCGVMREPMNEPTHELIPSGEWTAARFAITHWDLADEIQDVFLNLDPRAITRDVLDCAEGSKPKLARVLLLDDWFGEVADPYADEDDA